MTTTPHNLEITEDGSSVWVDTKRKYWMLGLIVPLLPIIGGLIAGLTGIGAVWWVGPVLLFGILPLVDMKFGTDTSNPPEDSMAALDADRFYRYIIWAYVPLQLASLVFGCWAWQNQDLSSLSKLGLALTVGTVAGIGINAAHELGHKRPNLERWLSKIALSQSLYGHFYTEHNRGHHKLVATPEDPASSRFGETLWEFLPRTVFGSLKSSIQIERDRSAKAGVSFWRPQNDLLNAWAMSIVLFGSLLAIFGLGILPLLIIQAVMGFLLLEVVNYLEHYGLARQKKANGHYEKCQPTHSWNANQVASNLAIYQLQRHSDHHANPTRRYQTLRHFDESPQLPASYPSMMLIALAPPLWRRVMDQRVLDHYDGDISLVNLNPRNKDRMLAKYGN